jgi:hypothetical protein
MNTIPASSLGNSRMATGTIAMAGIGELAGPAEHDAGDHTRDRGEREPGEDPDQ